MALELAARGRWCLGQVLVLGRILRIVPVGLLRRGGLLLRGGGLLLRVGGLLLLDLRTRMLRLLAFFLSSVSIVSADFASASVASVSSVSTLPYLTLDILPTTQG